jgi:D-arabinose 1-dehydrogenase-like Zn-dependent alcohol dehydrogenase
VRGSIVGTRKDLQEALDFANEGLVKATVTSAKLEDINDVFDKMKKGQIDGVSFWILLDKINLLLFVFLSPADFVCRVFN